MWGAAVYFAQNANYSAAYSFRTPLGMQQLFLSEVLVGDCVILPSNRSITKPPLKPNSDADYDSVQGFTGNSDVYMIY